MHVPPFPFSFFAECFLLQKVTPFLVPLIERRGKCCPIALCERQRNRSEFFPSFQLRMLCQFLRDGL